MAVTKPLTLTLARARKPSEPYDFPLEPQEYLLWQGTEGTGSATFPWGREVMMELEELQKPRPDSSVLQGLGLRLSKFLAEAFPRPGRWHDWEEAILQANDAGRPVHLTFCFSAEELYRLPWELTVISSTRQQLGALDECRMQYEWIQTHTPPLKAFQGPGRLLFGWSGNVPAADHLGALRDAYKAGTYSFDELRDVLPKMSLRGLVNALEEADTRGPVTALHLLCHGGPNARRTYGLRWNASSNGEDEFIDGAVLRRALQPYANTLRMVVLCACHSGHAELRNPLGSVAQALHELGIQVVVSSRLPLSVDGSVQFTRKLYRELLERRATVQEAMAAARMELLQKNPTWMDWAAVQLYARAEDGLELRPFLPLPAREAPARRARRVVFSASAPEQIPVGEHHLVLAYEVNQLVRDAAALAAFGSVPQDEPPPVVCLRPLGEVGEALPSGDGWERAFVETRQFVQALFKREAEEGVAPTLHVFGLARLPLMFYLGWRLSYHPHVFYQQQGKGGPWRDAYHGAMQRQDGERFFHVEGLPLQPSPGAGRVLVKVEVSLALDETSLGKLRAEHGASLIGEVGLVPVTGRSQTAFSGPRDATRALYEFREVLESLRCTPGVQEVLLVMACPASLAAALGAAFNPNAHLPVVLHDHRQPERYVAVRRLPDNE